MVHAIVIQAWGHPPALFNEGIAVAHQTDPAAGVLVPRWNGASVHDLARAAALPPLDAVVTSKGFFDYSDQLTYPMAGSFVRWLLDTRGPEPMKALFATANFDAPAADTEAKFAAAYGMELRDAWQRWQDWLAR